MGAQRTKLFPERLEFSEVGLVLALVIDLCLDTLKDPDGSRIVVDTASGAESGLDDTGA